MPDLPLPEWLRSVPRGVLLLLVIQPNAARSAWVGPFGAPPRMKLKIHAPPVDGAANAALVIFISKTIGLQKSRIELLRGHSHRQKDVLCVGIDPLKILKIISESLTS